MGSNQSCCALTELCFCNRCDDDGIVKFFNVSSEQTILEHFPFLNESLLHSIILRRSTHPFKNFEDVINLRPIRKLLVAKLRNVHLQSMQSVTVITEQPGNANTTNSGSNESYLPFPLSAGHNQILPPPVPSAPAEYDMSLYFPRNVIMLLEILRETKVLTAWADYSSHFLTISPQPPLCENVIRIATWNLNRFSVSKARHPGFREAICLTLLRNGIDLIAFQEVSDREAINHLCNELSCPTLPNVRRWFTETAQLAWRWETKSSAESTGQNFQSREYSAFLYRCDRIVPISFGILGRTSTNSPSGLRDKTFCRDPFLGKFRLGPHRLLLASVHLKSTGLRDSQLGRTSDEVCRLAYLIDAIKDTQPGNDYYALLGDFNLNPDREAFDVLRERSLCNVLKAGLPTMISAVERAISVPGDTPNPLTASSVPSCFDNAWICEGLQAAPCSSTERGLHFAGHANVISSNLRHPLIPSLDCVDFNGTPSDHCPLFFDLIIT